jgi:hypothetical protein
MVRATAPQPDMDFLSEQQQANHEEHQVRIHTQQIDAEQ